MPPSGAKGGGVASGHAYQTYQDFSSYEDDGQNMAAGFAGGYADGGYDAAYDDEYPPQQPYPHPGIRGLQYGGDGRQYAAGGSLALHSGAMRRRVMVLTVTRRWR